MDFCKGEVGVMCREESKVGIEEGKEDNGGMYTIQGWWGEGAI